tara:strand:+ start:499 stop:858 length:360 start_codon:yes stop_codon:yes gene_type:complete
MNKSELKNTIKEEIIDILEAVSQDDVKTQKDYNAELAKTAELQKSMGIDEEMDDDDKEPTKSQLKGDGIAFLATKLQQTTKEMKSIVNKWKTSEGQEKEYLTDRLRELTKIKKELESAL